MQGGSWDQDTRDFVASMFHLMIEHEGNVIVEPAIFSL